MPINGLTNVPKAFLKIGQIRKGMKDPQTGAPIDLDYFRVTFYPNEKECEQLFREVYGEQPRSINIRLAFPNTLEVWDANYECYNKGGMIAKASSTQDPTTLQDVIKWVFYRDHKTGEVLVRNGMSVGEAGVNFMQKPIDLTQPIYSYKNRKGETVNVLLEPVGRLNVVVPELASIRVGYMEFRPGSPKDIAAISRELAAIDHMARQAGKDLTGIPMKLTRREEEITKNINGQLSRGPSWLVHIEVGGEWGGKALEYIERKALPEWVEGKVTDVPEPVQFEELWDEEIAEDNETTPPIPQTKVAPRPEMVRPYTPEALKDWFDERVKYHTNLKSQVGEKSGQIIAKNLNNIFGNDTDRYVFTGWLVGDASTKKLSSSQIRSLLDWLDVETFEDKPVLEAITEAKDGLVFANALHGQLELSTGEPAY
jgi:hypothetical protein